MTSLERLTGNVYRVRRCDINKNLTELFDELRDGLMSDFSYIIITKRHDTKLNGSAKYIDGIDVDFRSHYLIIVKQSEAA